MTDSWLDEAVWRQHKQHKLVNFQFCEESTLFKTLKHRTDTKDGTFCFVARKYVEKLKYYKRNSLQEELESCVTWARWLVLAWAQTASCVKHEVPYRFVLNLFCNLPDLIQEKIWDQSERTLCRSIVSEHLCVKNWEETRMCWLPLFHAMWSKSTQEGIYLHWMLDSICVIYWPGVRLKHHGCDCQLHGESACGLGE